MSQTRRSNTVKHLWDVIPQFFPLIQNTMAVFEWTASKAYANHPILSALLKFDGDVTYPAFCPPLYPGGKKVLLKIFQNRLLPLVCVLFYRVCFISPYWYLSCTGSSYMDLVLSKPIPKLGNQNLCQFPQWNPTVFSLAFLMLHQVLSQAQPYLWVIMFFPSSWIMTHYCCL